MPHGASLTEGWRVQSNVGNACLNGPLLTFINITLSWAKSDKKISGRGGVSLVVVGVRRGGYFSGNKVHFHHSQLAEGLWSALQLTRTTGITCATQNLCNFTNQKGRSFCNHCNNKFFFFSLVTDSMAYSIGHVSVCIFYHDKDFKGRRGWCLVRLLWNKTTRHVSLWNTDVLSHIISTMLWFCVVLQKKRFIVIKINKEWMKLNLLAIYPSVIHINRDFKTAAVEA